MESTEALEEIVRTQLIDNPMDAIARQMRHIYSKLAKKEASLGGAIDREAQLTSLRLHYAIQLRELLAKGCEELELQRQQLTSCINIVEIDQKKGAMDDWYIQEVKRVYIAGPSHVYARSTAQVDIVTSDGTFRVPKGALVAAALDTTNKHPKVWTNPGEFNPNRFN
ncbi:hypothetical protein THRCLA_10252, partial [Thraustotheca clavata]